MPPSTRQETAGPSSAPQSLKRATSDTESSPQVSKKARRISSAEPHARRDSNRDTKRRRRKKKKTPVVATAALKSEAAQSLPDERSHPLLSARNEIIRFTSPPPGGDLSSSVISAANTSSQTPLAKPFGEVREGPSQTLGDAKQDGSEVMPPAPKDTKQELAVESSVPEPPASSLQDKVARLEAELESKNNLIVSHQALLTQVQQAVTCQVCLDLMYKPYALAPCGHLACHTCLVSWFTAPPADNRQTPPPISRRKTCPHCRAAVRERPIEVWGVKGIAQAIGRSELVPNPSYAPADTETSDAQDANADPWQDIFSKPPLQPALVGQDRRPELVLLGDEEDDVPYGETGSDYGMFDAEDGGIYRCLDCMHELWEGVCSNCARIYPGHGYGYDSDEDTDEDPVAWLDELAAEELDNPAWMGLEDGKSDDDDDVDDWHSFSPWRHWVDGDGPRGVFSDTGVDEEEVEDDDDMYGGVDLRLRIPDEDGADEDGYESSFIDDDEDGAPVERLDAFRADDLGDDDGERDEDYSPHRFHSEDQHEESDVPDPGRAGRRCAYATLVFSSDEEANSLRGQYLRRDYGAEESDGSNAYLSDY